ncbi:IS200/IS605 family transposase [Psychroflexus planctonicus]|uniref:Transposase n=1 Tax=Psychroflexus planctonicus TaxID=1526575 RepID=A0ABQ1SFH5_9FLAO|nr:IS200/IS605 family transposase [Psychroflexus planctonicus]GGE35554.1 transposase [Psychroflexus planctonicus]
MANTFTQVYIQIVFTVKGRQNLIHKKWKDELYKYICGIVNAKQQKVYAIGGVADHIHILVSIKPNISISELVRSIKANSSKWINEKGLVLGKFQWQGGFGAFSYAQSQLDTVIKYINNQEKHHKVKTFKDEYTEFLEKFEIDYDEKYLFKFIE